MAWSTPNGLASTDPAPGARGRWWRPRTRRGMALLVGSLLALAVIAPVAAAEFLSGQSPTVHQGESVDEDLYATGGEVEIAGTVERDLLVAATSLTITGTGRVNGNVNAAVGEANLSGNIGQSVRIIAGDVEIFGTIGGDLVVTGGRVRLADGASVRGDVIVAGGSVELLGDVGGDVRGSAGSVVLASRISGNVDLNSDDIEVRDETRIGGRLEYTGDNELDMDSGAVVAGGIDRTTPSLFGLEDGLVGWLTGVILRVLWLLVAGAVLVLLFPRGCVAVANGVRHRPILSFALGILLLIAAPIALLIMLVTVIGLPIAVIGIAAYLAVLYLSQVFVGLAIGRFILPNRWGSDGRGFNLLAMTIGVLILAGLRLIPVPYVGNVIALVIAIIGLGAAILGPRLRLTPPPGTQYGYTPY